MENEATSGHLTFFSSGPSIASQRGDFLTELPVKGEAWREICCLRRQRRKTSGEEAWYLPPYGSWTEIY